MVEPMDDSERGPEPSVDISETAAPSVGPNKVIEKESPEEPLAGQEQSKTDAMGLDKRREVIGGRYSASPARQAVTYAIVVVVLIGAGIGIKLLADDLDQPPSKVADQAPWTGNHRAPPPLQ